MSNDIMAPLSPDARRKEAKAKREQALSISLGHPLPKHQPNGEEEAFLESGNFPVSSFSKGLRHNDKGEVELAHYKQLRRVLKSGKHSDFASLPLGTPGGRKLTSPQAGLSYDLQGPDAQAVTMAPVPRMDSRQTTAEMIELYWMALLRDVPFTRFETNADVAVAAAELKKYQADLGRLPPGATVTPRTVFRGSTAGAMAGPYISQFLLREIPYGSLRISPLQQTIVPGCDYLTDFGAWLKIQNGQPAGNPAFDMTRRYIRNMRDMAHYVHRDALYQAYLNAALILLGMDMDPTLGKPGEDIDAGNPYRTSPNQEGFATFGGPHILSLVTEVATRALKAVWFQKWFVHRRLRPEEFGGRVDVHRRKLASYPVNAELLSSQAHERILKRYGSSLLPQAFPEGSPVHPAYGSGHATVAGACVTILKAWFDGGKPLRGPISVPNDEGTALEDYKGPDASKLTVGGELDKLAANISVGRNMAGVHWRTDYTESIRLGEQVALRLLQEQSILYNEPNVFTVVTFDGQTVKVRGGEILPG